MTAAADTFAASVTVLAEVMDDHEVGGEEIASRLYLSRFHFDRVISAVAGEAPSSFRRRVLLERAAYGSHEAFTRTFTRAFVQAPRHWRGHPTRTQIEAPSDVHFHPPGRLRLPAPTKVSSMNLLTKMVDTTSG